MSYNNLKVGDRIKLDYSKVNHDVPYGFPSEMADTLRRLEIGVGYLVITLRGRNERGVFYNVGQNGIPAHPDILSYMIPPEIIRNVVRVTSQVNIYEEVK